MARNNKALVRRAIEIANRGETPEDLFSSEHTIYVPFRGSGPEEPTESGGSPYHISVDDQIAAGDKVITRWTIHIRSGAEDIGDRAAGTERMVSGITIDRISRGKIEETWTSWNPVDYFRGNIEETWTSWYPIDPMDLPPLAEIPSNLGEDVQAFHGGGYPRRP